MERLAHYFWTFFEIDVTNENFDEFSYDVECFFNSYSIHPSQHQMLFIFFDTLRRIYLMSDVDSKRDEKLEVFMKTFSQEINFLRELVENHF